VTTVLVHDADQQQRRAMVSALRYGGYEVESAATLAHALMLVRRRPLAAVVVDPDGHDPFDVLRRLRRRSQVPIVAVSTPRPERAGVALLDAGADDFVAKPFDVDELLARLRAVLRRSVRPAEGSPVATPDFVVDPGAWRLRRADGSEVRLTPTEWRLVEALVRRAGRVVTQAELLEEVWGAEARGKTGYLRVQMRAIRRKVEPDPAHPRYFLTLPALGLLFVPEGRPA